jgi:hypothetical protein
MLKKLVFILFCLLISPFISMAQKKIENQLLVKFSSSDLALRASNHSRSSKIKTTLLSPDLNIYLYENKEGFSSEELKDLTHLQGVLYATYNYEAELRGLPNDPEYKDQWALVTSNINKVWEVTSGGKTKSGKDIVIGIIDNGIDISHEDLKDNIFKNSFENIGDKIDNDQNGYIDDVNGYNVDSRNGTPIPSSHGTGVAGILGAKADNSIGIAGVNWNVKMLPVHGVNKLDEIISANNYLLRMKRDYITSNGLRGANIVVVNYSGGISNAFGNIEPFKSWCDMYELLGTEGILSVGSTINSDIDVALQGDMPSTCVSEYLIVTTNSGKDGQKSREAGYSNKYIDMAAPGEVVNTTDANNSYTKSFSGTSASAPMIAGTIALFYSLPCFGLEDIVNKDRVLASRIIKEAIKDGVRKTSLLKQYTKWGGTLDAYASMQRLSKYCEGVIPSPVGPLNILNARYQNGAVTLEYLTPDNESTYHLLINDISGKTISYIELDLPKFGAKISTQPVGYLLPGIYFISVISKNGIATTKIFSE